MVSALAAVAWSVGGVAFLWSAARARQYWGEPAAGLFSAVAGTVGLASLCWAAVAAGANARVIAAPLLYNLTPLVWVLFALEYTGRIGAIRRDYRYLVAAPVAYLIVVYLGMAVAARSLLGVPLGHFELRTASQIAAELSGPVGSVVYAINISNFLGYIYLVGLLLVGTAVVGRQVLRYDHLSGAVGALLVVGPVGPWVVYNVGFILAEIDTVELTDSFLPLSLACLVGGLSYVWVLRGHDPFTATPVAGAIGHERVLQDMNDAVVVVDHEERLIRQNPAARQAFDTSGDDVGERLLDVIGEDVGSLTAEATVELSATDGRRQFEPTVSEMTGTDGGLLGCAIVLRDVTDRQMRQQRLAVLNRVLRHNLRNDMTTIRGRAELLTDDDADPSEISDTITDTADDLVALGQRAREIERMLSLPQHAREACDLGEVVASVAEEFDSKDAASVDVSVPDRVTVGVDGRVLRPVVRNLVVNGIEHGDTERPSVDVSASVGEGQLPVELSVADDGPGLPDNERLAIERGHENPLEHGSGLGLWAVKWGVTRMGGQLSIEDNDPRGTVVTIHLPQAGTVTEKGVSQTTADD